MPGKRRRKWLGFAVLAIALLGPPLAFGISNLLLMSPKGRSFVAARIQRVIRLEASVQGCTWSPWNGFTVYGLLVRQPAPLDKAIAAPMLSAESIRIHPDWHALANRRLVIRGIEIRKPHLAVAVELLSQIQGAPAEPNLAAKQPDSAVAQQPSGEDSATPNLLHAQPQAPVPPVDPTPAAKPGSPATAAATEPTVWVTLTDARLSIVSAMSKEPLYGIRSINGGLPLSGKSAGSELLLDGISLLGNAVPSPVKIPVKWHAPILALGVIDAGIFGIDCKLEAKIGLTPGIPFVVGGGVPKQDAREIALSDTLRTRFGSIAGQGRFQGYAMAPASWQGQSIIQMLSVDAEFAGNKTSFSHGQGLAVFQQGVLRCPDARLIGDDVSFLGNGMALGDGRFAANLRIVAAPENLVALSRRTQPDSSPPQLTPLSTPQRAALDMRVFGYPGKVFYQANPAAKPVLLR